MKESTGSGSRKDGRQIVGISLPPAIARDFKAEAARRGISLRKLFEELWGSYSKEKVTAGSR